MTQPGDRVLLARSIFGPSVFPSECTGPPPLQFLYRRMAGRPLLSMAGSPIPTSPMCHSGVLQMKEGPSLAAGTTMDGP